MCWCPLSGFKQRISSTSPQNFAYVLFIIWGNLTMCLITEKSCSVPSCYVGNLTKKKKKTVEWNLCLNLTFNQVWVKLSIYVVWNTDLVQNLRNLESSLLSLWYCWYYLSLLHKYPKKYEKRFMRVGLKYWMNLSWAWAGFLNDLLYSFPLLARLASRSSADTHSKCYV